jgi:hypothetical protein
VYLPSAFPIVVSPALGDCLKELRSAHSRILSELQQSIVLSTADTQAAGMEIANLRAQVTETEGNCNKLNDVLESLDKVSCASIQFPFSFYLY